MVSEGAPRAEGCPKVALCCRWRWPSLRSCWMGCRPAQSTLWPCMRCTGKMQVIQPASRKPPVSAAAIKAVIKPFRQDGFVTGGTSHIGHVACKPCLILSKYQSLKGPLIPWWAVKRCDFPENIHEENIFLHGEWVFCSALESPPIPELLRAQPRVRPCQLGGCIAGGEGSPRHLRGKRREQHRGGECPLWDARHCPLLREQSAGRILTPKRVFLRQLSALCPLQLPPRFSPNSSSSSSFAGWGSWHCNIHRPEAFVLPYPVLHQCQVLVWWRRLLPDYWQRYHL